MATYTIDTLPAGFTVCHTIDHGTNPKQEWYSIHTDSAASGKLDPGSPTFQTDIDAFVASQTATAETATATTSQIIGKTLAAAKVTPGALESNFQTLLGQAKAAIPFFEYYALDPSLTSQQWDDFVALPQSPSPGTPEAVSKDRILYDLVRSMAALMRYLTGDL